MSTQVNKPPAYNSRIQMSLAFATEPEETVTKLTVLSSRDQHLRDYFLLFPALGEYKK
jgi:hypothetical protein